MKSQIPIIELFLSIISLWWAFICFSNPHLFDHIPQMLNVFAKVSQEVGWGFVFISAALIKILGILLQKYWIRRVGLLLSALLYGLITAGLILSKEPLTHSTGTYFAMTVLAMWGAREVKFYNA